MTLKKRVEQLTKQLAESEARIRACDLAHEAVYSEYQKTLRMLEASNAREIATAQHQGFNLTELRRRAEAAELISLELAKALQRRG